MFYFYDSTYILIIIGMVLSLGASAYVNGTFSRYSRMTNARGITGAEAALRLLRSQGIGTVSVQQISGSLTDHYNPAEKILRLSDPVFGSGSVSAVAVAAHECGHAIQDDLRYAPLRIRTAIVPVASFGAKTSWILIAVSFLLGGKISLMFLYAGTILFCLALLFELVTLPVEFDASSRALRLLDELGILSDGELAGAKKVLRAAALTYVASVAASLLQLLRLLIIIGGRRGND